MREAKAGFGKNMKTSCAEYRGDGAITATRKLNTTPERYAQWYKNTGTPRKDDIAAEAQQLKANGKSYHQIAIALNQKYGPDTTNSEAVRARLRSRKRQATPDKTCSISSVE
jgi:hypothetical protein